MLNVLLVDDEPAVRASVARALSAAGHRVTQAEDGAQAFEHILTRVFDVAIFDIRLPRVDGLTLFRRLRFEAPSTVVILMTAYARVTDAVEAIRAGAHDYVLKPFDPVAFVANVVGPISERQALRHQFERARSQLTERDVGTDFVGCSPLAARVRAEIEAAAQSRAPLLVTGERGTGKRLVARLVHARSPRRDRPYVLVSCATLPAEDADSALFEPASGASPGGCFTQARGGTLTLHEVGDLSASSQAMLSAALGDNAADGPISYPRVPTEVRIIGTSHEDLPSRVPSSFREELLFKLQVLEIHLLPLRERPADLPLLVASILEREGRGAPPKLLPPAWDALRDYSFPGNVAELERALRHAMAVAKGSPIAAEHLPAEVASAASRRAGRSRRTSSGTHVVDRGDEAAPAPPRKRRNT